MRKLNFPILKQIQTQLALDWSFFLQNFVNYLGFFCKLNNLIKFEDPGKYFKSKFTGYGNKRAELVSK